VWLLAGKAEPATLIDACFAWIVAIARRGIGHSVHPKRVEFQRPEANRRLYEDHFACPVKFGARHNMLLFRSEDLAQPFLTHNPDLLEMVAPQLEAELTQQLAHKSLKEQVKGILKKFLAGQRPRLEDVASNCGHTRTPQRRLLRAHDVSEPGGSAARTGEALSAGIRARTERLLICWDTKTLTLLPHFTGGRGRRPNDRPVRVRSMRFPYR
jgi:hypothetical protein